MSTTIGQQLRRRREERNLTLEEAASATRIRAHYLRTMEAGEFRAIPSAVQARGFLRAYADYLNLNSELLLAELEGKTVPTSAQHNNGAGTSADTPAPVPNGVPVGAPSIGLNSVPLAGAAAEPPASDAEAQGRLQAAAIFQEVGRGLQRQRELLGLSLEDVERHTHLRRHYLTALEAGNLESLPSPVQGRGMLNNYATFLGLNPEPLLLRFAEGLQTRLAARQSTLPEKKRPTPQKRKSRLPGSLRRSLTGDLLIGASLAIFLIIFVSWLAIRIFSLTNQQVAQPTAPSIAQVLLATATPTETATPLPVTPTSPPVDQFFPTQALVVTDAETGAALQGGQAAGVQMYISVRQRSWMRVVVDNKVEFEGRVIPGSAYNFAGENAVELMTSNAAGIRVFFNGIDLGPLGGFGQVVSQIYGKQGAITPTPTITLTPTVTAPVPPTQIPAVTPPPAGATPAQP